MEEKEALTEEDIEKYLETAVRKIVEECRNSEKFWRSIAKYSGMSDEQIDEMFKERQQE